jgi:F-type H+-transporting ATPase subunit alpha
MKKVAGTLKLDQGQYRELEAFQKFGSDMDAATLAVLDKGAKNVEILKQGQYSPFNVEDQVAILFCGTQGLLRSVPTDKVKEFEKDFLDFMKMKHKDVMAELGSGKYTKEAQDIMRSVAAEVAAKYK